MKRERISFPFRFQNNNFNKCNFLCILRFLCKIELRKENRTYYFSVEGETEQWYL